MSRPLSDRLRLLALALTVLVAGACVRQEDPGVAVQDLQSNIAFGVKQAEQAGIPETFSTPEGLTAELGGADFDISQDFLVDPGASKRAAIRRASPSTPNPCPAAPINAFPERAALENLPLDVLPAEGTYRYKKSGVQQRSDLPVPIGISGFERRVVRNLVVTKKAGTASKSNANPEGYDAAFTYEVVQPNLTGDRVVVTTYRVRTAARSAEADPYGEGNKVVTGEPDRGLSILRIETFDTKGNLVSSFKPSVPLLLMPLGVRPGERFSAAAADPTSGITGQVTGRSIRRERVDACGEILEGWLHETTVTFGGRGSTSTRTYNFIGSTNLGGILIGEQVEETNPEGTFKLTYTIGQSRPDPAPGS